MLVGETIVQERAAHGARSSDAPRKVAAGDEGIWTFIAADMVLFALLFTVFMQQRAVERQDFDAASALLSSWTGVTNTLVLLTSSLFVAIALHRLGQGNRSSARTALAAALLCGLVFVGIKIYEYHHLVTAGSPASARSFLSYYFILTGIHLAHLTGGLVALFVVRYRLGVSENILSEEKFAQCAAIYWHMVDLLWIMIFPLLYLIGSGLR